MLFRRSKATAAVATAPTARPPSQSESDQIRADVESLLASTAQSAPTVAMKPAPPAAGNGTAKAKAYSGPPRELKELAVIRIVSPSGDDAVSSVVAQLDHDMVTEIRVPALSKLVHEGIMDMGERDIAIQAIREQLDALRQELNLDHIICFVAVEDSAHLDLASEVFTKLGSSKFTYRLVLGRLLFGSFAAENMRKEADRHGWQNAHYMSRFSAAADKFRAYVAEKPTL